MQIDLYREKFMAIPEKPSFNNGFQTKYFAEDPTTMVFSLFFEFDSPLLNPASNKGESAERYFKSLGDEKRMKKVIEFRERIMHLIDQTPYLLRSIDGLSDIYDYNAKEIYVEREITIKTYETLDLRISKLAELYTDIVWDFENQKRILPDNLEWINYHIISNDVRELVMFIKGGDNGEMAMENVTAYLDSFVFSFRNGKFSFAKSNNMLGSISNEDPTVGDNSFRLIGGKFSKKKNRITLSNDEKNASISKITGRRTTEAPSQIEEMSTGNKIKSIIKKKALDFARDEATRQISANILDPLKSKLSNVENSLLAFNELNFNSILNGDQNIGDLVDGVTSAITGADRAINGKILSKKKIEYTVQESISDIAGNRISIEGLSNEEIINLILNDVNRRLAYTD